MTDEELKRLFESLRTNNEAMHAETRRHFDVALESARDDFKVVADKTQMVGERLTREAEQIRHEMRSGFAETQAMLKFSHAELDRRLSALEVNQGTLQHTVAELQTRIERLESR